MGLAGSSLGSTATRPATQPSSQPAVDKSKACCKYTRKSTVGFSPGRGETLTRRFQKEEANTGNWDSPEEVCKCAHRHRAEGMGVVATDLDSAKWGKCCWCRAYHTRGPTGVLSHSYVYISCDPPDGRGVTADFRTDGTVNAALLPKNNGGLDKMVAVQVAQATMVIRNKQEFDCEHLDSVWGWIEKDKKNNPIYWWGHDCATWADKIVNYGPIAGYGRE